MEKLNKIIDNIKSNDRKVIDRSEWKEFKIGELFKVLSTKTREIANYNNEGNIPFVASGSANNGIEKYISVNEQLDKGNCITVSSLDMSAFYQERDFLGRGHGSVNKLYHGELNKDNAIFLCTLIKQNGKKYNYSNQCFLNKLKNEVIKLPTNKDTNKPDWQYMEQTIINLRKRMNIDEVMGGAKLLNDVILRIKNFNKNSINKSNWQLFKIGDLFEIKGSKTTSKQQLEKSGKGIYPYITTQATSNGVAGFYNHWTEKGNCLTIDSAVLGTCFYQEQNFTASDHVEMAIPKFEGFNKNIGLFMTLIINKANNGKYSYGLKYNQTRIRETIIKLPTLPNTNKPDWQYMENYIKNMRERVFI